MKSNYEEKRQARIERYQDKADNLHKQGETTHTQAHDMASVIPFGQPILMGHHSEKADRRYRDRINNKFRKSFELEEKAKHYEEKARSAEKNMAISSDDPEAVRKLAAKLEKAEKFQEVMKVANKIIKRKAGTPEEKKSELVKLGLSWDVASRLFVPDFLNRIGFPDFALSNNNAKIRSIKQRIAMLQKASTAEHKETEHEGLKIVENVEENRIQLIFDGKPPLETRNILKRHGFRWSRFNMAWQRHLNDSGRFAAECVVKALKL